MEYISFAICIFLLIFSLKKGDNLYCPTIIFLMMWSIILFLNMINAFGINQATNGAYQYICIGLVSLFLGNLLARNVKWSVFFLGGHKRAFSYQMRFTAIYCLMILTTLFLFLDLKIAVNGLLQGNSLTTIRDWYGTTYSSGISPIKARRGYMEQVLRVILIEPFLCSLPFLCTINLYSSHRNKIFLLFSIILLVTNVISTGGGRLGILTYAMTFILGFFIYKRKYFMHRLELVKYKKWIKRFSIVGAFAIIFLTLKRSSTGIFEHVYYYFAMCVPLLDRWIPYISNSPHTYGMLSFFGILRIPFLVMEKLGLNVPATYETAQGYILQANQFYSVGAMLGNSFVSPFYYLYLDGGIVGIVLGMFAFGYASEIIYKKARYSLDDKRVYYLLLFCQMAFMSFIRWQFIGTAFAMAFVYAGILFKKA